MRRKGRRGGGIRAENQAQSYRSGCVSTAIETAGQSEGQAADRETTFRGRSRCIPSLTVETDRLDRCIESDLVAELEAIGECLLWAEKNRFAYGTYAGTNLWT